jgi:hypothetical protein
MHWSRDYEGRDAVMALYAPVTLLALPAVWLVLVQLGFMAMFWALGARSVGTAYVTSGSSLLTLGFAPVSGPAQTLLAFSEAAIGLILVALLIAYLPTMYAAFSRREAVVTMLEVRAGSPPSAVEMIARFQRLERMPKLYEHYIEWEEWFVALDESHTSLAALAFFRSPQANRHWTTAAGTILDTGALLNAAVDLPHDAQVDLCLRAGYIALRNIADFFRISHNANPTPDEPISIARAEFDAALDQLAERGVPLKPDRDQAWRDFAGWRVNYDTVLLALSALSMAPRTPWTADRLPVQPIWRTRLQAMQQAVAARYGSGGGRNS